MTTADDGDPGYLITARLLAPNGGTLSLTFRHPLQLGADDDRSPDALADNARAILAAYLDPDVITDVEVL